MIPLVDFSAGGKFKIRVPLASQLVIEFVRSEEHTSELQSQSNLVCRLLLEKKKMLNFFTLQVNITLFDTDLKAFNPDMLSLSPIIQNQAINIVYVTIVNVILTHHHAMTLYD